MGEFACGTNRGSSLVAGVQVFSSLADQKMALGTAHFAAYSRPRQRELLAEVQCLAGSAGPRTRRIDRRLGHVLGEYCYQLSRGAYSMKRNAPYSEFTGGGGIMPNSAADHDSAVGRITG